MQLTVSIAVAVLLCAVACSAQYQPNWASLDSRPLPDWYDKAKVGIFIHWGVFSVPSFGDEWFWWAWQGTKDPAYQQFMADNYPPGFSYADFGPQLTAEFFDPDQWASIFKKSGAQYIVLTSKHHEGWTNWKSKESFNWNSVENGPHKDLIDLLTTAVRKAGLTMGLYHSLFEWFHPLYLQDKANNFTTNLFVEQVTMPQLYEIVNAYQPDVIWSDGDWEAPDTYWNSTGFLAWLYNDSPVKNTVVTNDRWGNGIMCKHGGFFTCSDRFNPGHLLPHKWENAFTVDKNSWGYVRKSNIEDYMSFYEIIEQVVTTVSCGGNALINVGPTKDGLLIPVFQERLLQLGSWLDINGVAIYDSLPWRAQNETASDVQVWYTQAGGVVYATLLGWPANSSQITITTPVADAAVSSVSMLGYSGGALKWSVGAGGKGMQITLPALSPADALAAMPAWTLALVKVQ